MKIVIIDDDALVCASLKTILEATGKVSVAAAGSDGSDALPLYCSAKPDVLLMDIRMRQISGIEAGERLLSVYPEAKILFLTTFSDDEYIVRALKMGARGYILKQNFEGILPALNAVMSGHRVFGEEIIEKLPIASAGERPALHADITEKEHEIIKLVANGLSNREIAAALYLSEGTVRNYLSAVLVKLELRNRTQLAIHYYKNIK